MNNAALDLLSLRCLKLVWIQFLSILSSDQTFSSQQSPRRGEDRFPALTAFFVFVKFILLISLIALDISPKADLGFAASWPNSSSDSRERCGQDKCQSGIEYHPVVFAPYLLRKTSVVHT